MKMLARGAESKQRLGLLISLTRLSETYHEPLKTLYCEGLKANYVVAKYKLDKQNFTRAMKTLEAVAGTVEKIKELDWVKFKKSVK